MKYQVPESQVHIRTDLLDVFVRVGRHDPSRRGALERQRVREFLHGHRVFHRYFFFRRQGERTPIPGIVQRAPGVGIERHLHLDHAIETGFPASGNPDALVDVGQQLFRVQRHGLAAGADESVAGAPGVLGNHGPGGRHIDRNRPLGTIVDRGTLGPVILARERHAVLGPQFSYQRDRLAQPRKPFLHFRPGLSRRRYLV